MVTRSHTQLKENEITEDKSVCDSSQSSQPNLKNFVVNKDESHEEPYLDTVIKIQCISTLQQDVKRSESLLNHFLGVLWKKQGVLSHFKELRNLAK